jgi:hypothetical protein
MWTVLLAPQMSVERLHQEAQTAFGNIQTSCECFDRQGESAQRRTLPMFPEEIHLHTHHEDPVVF